MKWRALRSTYTDRLIELREQLAQDPYAVLGLVETASDEEVKLAYRKHVSSYHPDKQGEFFRAHSQEVMKVINAAYEQICAKRKS